jgi:hypothetical protein
MAHLPRNLLFSVFFLLILSPSFVSAYYGSISDTVYRIVNWEIPAPQYILSDGYQGIPLWAFVLVFMMLFSVLWLASGQVPLFKAKENLNSRKMFVIAIALLTIFTTRVVFWIIWLVKAFTILTLIAITIAGAYTIYVLTHSSIAENRKTDAESSKKMANAKQVSAEADRISAQAKEYNEKTKHASKHGLKQQLGLMKRIQNDMGNIVSTLQTVRRRLTNPTDKLGRPAVNRLVRYLDDIAVELGHLISYQTNNDRILTGMSTANYTENNTGSLTNINTLPNDPSAPTPDAIRRRIDIHGKALSQTNDLGHAIHGLRSLIVTDGISGNNINKLLEVALNAQNIFNRMQRDIVLESQMIEKI